MASADSAQWMLWDRWQRTGRGCEGGGEDSILRNSLRERHLQERLRLSGQRSKGSMMVKCFGNQGQRAFKKDSRLVVYSTAKRSGRLSSKETLADYDKCNWMEWWHGDSL